VSVLIRRICHELCKEQDAKNAEEVVLMRLQHGLKVHGA